jgi:Aspartyl protease
VRTVPLLRALGTCWTLVLLCSCATQHPSGPQLPTAVSFNKGAGRGNLLFVPVRLAGGEELEFVVDTGSSQTLLDKSLEPKLGKRLGTVSMQHWGATDKLPVYAAPRIYLGGAQLMTGKTVAAYDFKTISSRVGRTISGMLSMDCLKYYCLQLDFEAGQMGFLDSSQLEPANLGKAFPVTFARGGRPFINHVSLAGGIGTNSLIDTGFDIDGRVEAEAGIGTGRRMVRLRKCVWDGDTYTNLLVEKGENANLLGLRFLARHLVTLDFPNRTMYLLRQSPGPLPRNGPN